MYYSLNADVRITSGHSIDGFVQPYLESPVLGQQTIEQGIEHLVSGNLYAYNCMLRWAGLMAEFYPANTSRNWRFLNHPGLHVK